MKPPWRVTRAPTSVGSPLGGSIDLAPPIHSGSRRGSNMIAATCPGLAATVREAVMSIALKRTSGSPAPDQSHGQVALEQIEAGPRRLPAWPRQSAVAVEQQLRVALSDR